MMDELNPCPFCGQKDVEVIGDDSVDWVAQCIKCGAFGGGRPTRAKAAEAWNTRVFECEADEYGGVTVLNRRFAPQELCTVAGVYVYGERDELRVYSLSCGHEFQWDHVDPPAYCPVCGAKVFRGAYPWTGR